ncbi:uncharacterized protein LOC108913793 [Anoplophora glabripennis]|uniref:uncharacterized protein LOC108913793 n=1 Tax=Anoplophora glabripennis TaxID=217634 RepID=UPI00087451AB|nr:uncharacterized protein LOC108913793 [Anoplophora glabripennis]
MKVVIVFFALVAGISAATLPESEKTLLKQIHDSCQASPSTHVDENLLRHMTQHSQNPKVKAHMLCMAQGAGMMSHSGVLKMSVIKSKMAMTMHDEHLIDTTINKCVIQKEDPMETSMDMWMCFMQNNIGYMHAL